MRCYLKSEKVKIDALGTRLEIRELSAAGQAAIMDALNKKAGNHIVAAISAAHCVVEWAGEDPEIIAANVGFDALSEIGAAVQRVSGIDPDPKASKSAQAVA